MASFPAAYNLLCHILLSETLHTEQTPPSIRCESRCVTPLKVDHCGLFGPCISISPFRGPASPPPPPDRPDSRNHARPQTEGRRRAQNRLPPHLPAPSASASRATLPAGAGAACSSGPADSARPRRRGWRQSPPRRLPTPFGALGWVLETEPCDLGPTARRVRERVRGARARLGHGDLQGGQPPGVPGSRAFPPRTREATETPHLTPGSPNISPPEEPARRCGGPGPATCVQRRVCAPRPWGGAGGLRATPPELLRAAGDPELRAFFPSRSGSLCSLPSPGFFPSPHSAHPPRAGTARWAPRPWDR